MQRNRYTAFVDKERMDLARSYGLTNFSGFVNDMLVRYIEQERSKISVPVVVKNDTH